MNKLLVFFELFLIGALVACSSADKKETETPEAYFARAQELAKDGRTEEAIIKYDDVKNKFPYSKLAVEAELAAADLSFDNEDYADAQVAYTLFRDLHPKHPKSAYVVFRLGNSIYRQIPESIDRDLTLTHEAITTFESVISEYPASEYVAEAKTKRLDCLKKLAEKELYIANFYLKKGKWDSALNRLQGILAHHKQIGFEEKALARAVLAAKKANKNELSESYLGEFKKSFPNSNELNEINGLYLSHE